MLEKKKRNVKSLCMLLAVSMCFVLAFGSCGGTQSSESAGTGNSAESAQDSAQDSGVSGSEENSSGSSDGFSVAYRAGYTPEKFDGDVSYTYEELTDGLTLVKNTVTKSGGDISVVYALEADLSEVDIHAGTSGNVTDTQGWVTDKPYAQAQAWAEATGGTVYASVNADFFGGNLCVNAFVKDGHIVKNGHNDNGNYDYLNAASDVPASAPMLFGVKGSKAQIAPIVAYEGDITTAAVKQKVIQSKLFYRLSVSGASGTVTENAVPDSANIAFNTALSCEVKDAIAVKVDVSQGYKNMKVLESTKVLLDGTFTPEKGEYAYLIALRSNASAYEMLGRLSAGKTCSVEVASEDGTWNGYDTILGCRQALVIDDGIADTVTLENTNGAQSPDVPRTCVGLKEDGTVVVFMVESMYYGKKETTGDTHGMNLPELAEFVYYYGCVQAANFDGGGSSQMIVKGENDGEARVLVRSSDTASYTPMNTRSVISSLLITSKAN